MNKQPVNQAGHTTQHRLMLKPFDIEGLTENMIARYSPSGAYPDLKAYQHIFPASLEINRGSFSQYGKIPFPTVSLVQEADELLLECSCPNRQDTLCEHQALVLTALLKRDELGVFFNTKLRHEKLRKFAADYGLQNETNPDDFFQITYQDKKLVIIPRLPSLIPVTKDSLSAMGELLLQDAPLPPATGTEGQAFCVVIRQHKYYKHLQIECYRAASTKDGKIKNPLTAVNPLDFIWESDNQQHLKFFAGLNKFQQHANAKRSEADIAALRAIAHNPPGFDFYYHDSSLSENITASSIVPVKINILPNDINLSVTPKGQFYELDCQLHLNGQLHSLKDLSIRFTYFIHSGDTFYLVDRLAVLGIFDLLKKKAGHLLVHHSKYNEFRLQLLSRLEDKIAVAQSHIAPASPAQLEQQGFNSRPGRTIYLSDFGQHVMIIPVITYGGVEIPIRSKRRIYAKDDAGNEFLVLRDDKAEIAFTALLLKQHPYFEEQLENDLYYFYLHKKHFLNEAWFLNTFESWRSEGIVVLGFDEIEGNKLNPNKVSIHIQVLSGMNWFNTIIDARFGKKKVSLKQLHKALRNKSKYVQLDDGTLGILPDAWIEKLSAYFNAGEIAGDDSLHIPKVNFSAVEELYEANMLDDAVKNELALYRERLAGFNSVGEVAVPKELNAELRPYQKEGLNWLNFLDDFNFGGCLADDMGLGKSIQIIAFILSQRTKSSHNTNLLVVPATLIFNWQAEVEKFAPSLRIHTIYGTDRKRNTHGFDQYEIILTSYGTLLSDIGFLQDYTFNYIFLDESQNIRNIGTQRYRAVRLLKSRNKIAITGTPVENNTFDLYSQLSFACPGLLGSSRYFRNVYSIPIDRFKDTRHAVALQNKTKPFVLRRTKQQVAPELPDKTEMVLYCEMGDEQRGIYNAYEKEFRDYISATNGEELKKNPMNTLKGLTRLRQVCDSPLLLGRDALPGTASAKIETLLEQIESKIHRHKILVFSQFVSMLELIKNELDTRGIPYTWLTGSTRNREAVVNEFQDNPAVKVFLISLKAGGTGLNLTEADYIYLVDPWWNPAVENQAIDRAHRIGQDKKVMAVRLICPGTVEDKIMKLQESKKQLIGDLVNTDTSFLSSLSKEDLLGLFQ